MAGILIAAIPTLGLIDPAIREKASVIGNNLDSAVAWDAWQRWRKNPTLGKAVYAEICLALNAHLLGYLSDNLVGLNIESGSKMASLGALNIPEIGQLTTIEIAAGRIANGIQNRNRRSIRAGAAELLDVAGGVGAGAARQLGKKKVRVPRKMLFRHALGAGP